MITLLTIEDNKIVAKRSGMTVAVITSLADLSTLREKYGNRTYASSSLDFPEEYTSDPAVIELAQSIRS